MHKIRRPVRTRIVRVAHMDHAPLDVRMIRILQLVWPRKLGPGVKKARPCTEEIIPDFVLN